MASLQRLKDNVASYLNRQDQNDEIRNPGLFAGWVSAIETELAETLRSRCQLTYVIQDLTAAEITLPDDFASMASMVDNVTGCNLQLKDEWSGSWYPDRQDDYNITNWADPTPAASYYYRLVGNCVEFLPHPQIPDDTSTWTPQQVKMGYYQKPLPLVLPTDTNPILEAHYEIYLWGVIQRGALWALDADRAQQADGKYQQVVTRANTWKQQSDYSGAPFRAEMSGAFA